MPDRAHEVAERIVESFLADHAYQVVGIGAKSSDPRAARAELKHAIAAALVQHEAEALEQERHEVRREIVLKLGPRDSFLCWYDDRAARPWKEQG